MPRAAAKRKAKRAPRQTPPSTDARRFAAENMHVGALHGSMVEFQYLEEALRRCIEYAYDIVRAQTRGLLSFKLTRKDLETAALGRLIDVFSKLVDEDALVVGLRGLVRDRNHSAHAAFMLATMMDKDSLAALRKHTKQHMAVYRRTRAANGRVMKVLGRLSKLKALTP